MSIFDNNLIKNDIPKTISAKTVELLRHPVYTAQRQKLRFLLNGILYVAYEQEIYSLLTLRFHKFEKTQSVKLGSIEQLKEIFEHN